MTEEQLNQAIARIILSTKRQKRIFSLFDIANDIKILKESKGSLDEVSKIVGISPGMLNQFLSIFKLPQSIQDLVKNREIDSVSAIHMLSKFDTQDCSLLAHLFIGQEITSQDLRVLLPYRKQNPTESIKELIEKIQASKNIKVSVIKIPNDQLLDAALIQKRIVNIIGEEEIIAVENNKNHIDIKITKVGEKKLRGHAKLHTLTLQQLIMNLTT